MRPDCPKTGQDSPLFRADSATLTFARQEGGKIRVTGHALAKDYLAVAATEAFEIVLGPQGVEGRVVPRLVAPSAAEPDPFWIPDDDAPTPRLEIVD